MAYKKLPDLTIPDTKKNSERELRKNNERSVCFCNNYHIYASIFTKKNLFLEAYWQPLGHVRIKKSRSKVLFFGHRKKEN
jgi:hypothetical protein